MKSRKIASPRKQTKSIARDWFLVDSAWDDDVWKFAPTNRMEEIASLHFRWDFGVSGGCNFTDLRFKGLCVASKEFVASLLSRPNLAGTKMRANTAIGYAFVLRALIKWMNEVGLRSFSQIGPEEVRTYAAWLRTRRGVRGKTISKLTIERHLLCLQHLYRHREFISDSLQSNPFPGETAGRFLGVRDLEHERWPYTPDAVAAKLVHAAVRFIDSAPKIFLARSIYANSLRTTKRASRAWREIAANKALSKRSEETRDHLIEIRSARDLARVTRLLYAACFIVIAYLVGLRRGELLTLKAGCVKSRNEGDANYDFIQGNIYKRDPAFDGRPHEWIAPPAAVRAIEVLEKLSFSLRRLSGRAEIWLRGQTLSASTAISDEYSGKVEPYRSRSVNPMLCAFAEAIDLKDEAGAPWRLSSHQGRKTFARFAALRDRSSFFALAQHLGHRERATTCHGYAGNDYDLEREIGREVINQSVGAWESMLAARHLGGKGGAEIMEKRPRFRGSRAKEDLVEYAKVLVDAGLTLGICDWGYCVYRQEYSACRGGIAGPNPSYREPSTCARCKNFAVGELHRPFWREQVKRYDELRLTGGIGSQTKAIALQRKLEAEQILGQLDQAKSRGES